MKRLLALVLVCIAGLWLWVASAASPPRAGANRGAEGFQNNYLAFEPKGLSALLKWRIEAAREGLPRPPQTPTPSVAPDLAFLASNAAAGAAMQPAVTWIGHATVLAQMGGINLLTDPQFSQRASPLSFIEPKRHVAPGVALEALPHIDVVLISHNHYDHLDDASVRALAAQAAGPPLFVVPLGLKAWLAQRDITNVIELDWWQSLSVNTTAGAVEVVLTPVQHWSGRGLTDRMASLWGGFAVFAPDLHLFFSGDTGYSNDFTDIREQFARRQRPEQGGGFDIALIAIGGYEPRWFMASQHVNPAEAVQVHLDLGAKRSMGVHWGTFDLTDESLDEPPRALSQARRDKGLDGDAFFVLAVGETRRIAPRPAASREPGSAASARPQN